MHSAVLGGAPFPPFPALHQWPAAFPLFPLFPLLVFGWSGPQKLDRKTRTVSQARLPRGEPPGTPAALSPGVMVSLSKTVVLVNNYSLSRENHSVSDGAFRYCDFLGSVEGHD